MKIIKNFLEYDFFIRLKKLVMESEFSWFQRKNMDYEGDGDDMGYFTHSFFTNNMINCNHYNHYITPILHKLKAKAPIQVRANLVPSSFYGKKGAAFHIDQEYKCKNAILYLNSCNGGTEFKIKDKIKLVKSEENKVVIFNSNTYHRGVKSTNADFRYLINFNYF